MGSRDRKSKVRFTTNIEAEIVYSDGAVRSRIFRPCDAYMFFPLVSGFRPPERTVFVDRILLRRRGTVVHSLDGSDLGEHLEEAPPRIRSVFVDEAGYRFAPSGTSRCATLLSAFDAPVQVDIVYDDDTEWSTMWQPCTTYLWESAIGRRGTAHEHGSARSMVISRNGTVVHDLDQRAIRETFRAYLNLKIPFLYVVDESGFKEVDRRKLFVDDYTHEHCARPSIAA